MVRNFWNLKESASGVISCAWRNEEQIKESNSVDSAIRMWWGFPQIQQNDAHFVEVDPTFIANVRFNLTERQLPLINCRLYTVKSQVRQMVPSELVCHAHDKISRPLCGFTTDLNERNDFHFNTDISEIYPVKVRRLTCKRQACGVFVDCSKKGAINFYRAISANHTPSRSDFLR